MKSRCGVFSAQGILIFVRSYFDFVRLRNFLKKEEASVALNHEYLDPKDVNRARSYFYNGTNRIMVRAKPLSKCPKAPQITPRETESLP